MEIKAARCTDRSLNPWPAFAHNDPDKVDRVFGPELFHDPRTMDFDRARADAQAHRRVFVGGSLNNAGKNVLLAPRQRFPAREIYRRASWSGATMGGIDGLANPSQHLAAPERLF